MSEKKKSGLIIQIIVGIILALAVGGSSPWWWNKIFPESEPGQPINPGTSEDPPNKESQAQHISDFPGGSRRVYIADFSSWPTEDSEHGTISLTYTNCYEIQPFSNTWMGPQRLIDIPSVEGDFVFDIWFELQSNPSSSLQFQLYSGGNESIAINAYLSVWGSGSITYSLTRYHVRSGGGLPIPYVVRSEEIVMRQELPDNLKSHDWTKESKMTLKREGGSLYFFVNDGFVKQFPTSLFPVTQIYLSAAFKSKVVITSIEARVKN